MVAPPFSSMNGGNRQDHWLHDATRECALLLIDYQPGVMSFIQSSDPKLVELNARYLTKAAVAFGIPVILSTVGVQMGVNHREGFSGPTDAAAWSSGASLWPQRWKRETCGSHGCLGRPSCGEASSKGFRHAVGGGWYDVLIRCLEHPLGVP